jgi:hypothetical protein
MIRDLALALLDDDNGISEEAWAILQEMLEESGNGDIMDAIDSAEGRFFISEDDRDILEG